MTYEGALAIIEANETTAWTLWRQSRKMRIAHRLDDDQWLYGFHYGAEYGYKMAFRQSADARRLLKRGRI